MFADSYSLEPEASNRTNTVFLYKWRQRNMFCTSGQVSIWMWYFSSTSRYHGLRSFHRQGHFIDRSFHRQDIGSFHRQVISSTRYRVISSTGRFIDRSFHRQIVSSTGSFLRQGRFFDTISGHFIDRSFHRQGRFIDSCSRIYKFKLQAITQKSTVSSRRYVGFLPHENSYW